MHETKWRRICWIAGNHPLTATPSSSPPPFPSHLTCHISNGLPPPHLRACLPPTLICPCLSSLCVQVCLVTEVDRSTCPLPLLLHPTLGDAPLGTLDMVCILHSVCMCVCVCVPTQVCVHSLEVQGVACVSLFIIDVPPTSTLLRSQVNFLNLLKLVCVHLHNH